MKSRYHLNGIDWVVQALHRDSRKTPGGDYQFFIAVELNASPDPAKLQECLNRTVRLFSPVQGRFSRDWLNLAPYWKTAKTIAECDFKYVKVDSADAIHTELEKWLNLRFNDKSPLVAGMLLKKPDDTAVFSCKFDHRIFDAAGGEKFLELLRKNWDGEKIEPEKYMSMQGPWLNEWKHQFECGRTVNRVFRQVNSQGVPAELCNNNKGTNHFRRIVIAGDDFKQLLADSDNVAGPMMLMPYLQSLIQNGLHQILKQRGVENAFCLCPISVDLRAMGSDELFFNNWSMMPMYSHSSDFNDLKNVIEAQKELFYEYMKNRFPYCLNRANMLTRIAPLPIFTRFAVTPFHGTAGTAMTALLNREEFNSPDLFGCGVVNLYHVPKIPARPGIGIFMNRKGDSLNVTLSWIDGVVNESELEILSRSLTDNCNHSA